MHPSQANSAVSLDELAYKRILDMILSGELESGSKIVQHQFAAKLGISRTPLRRALANLERDHFLDATANGYFVRRFDMQYLMSLWEVRAVLEGLACRLLAPVIDEATTSYMRVLFTSAYKRFQEGDQEAYWQADQRFHTMVLTVANNPILQETMGVTLRTSVTLGGGAMRNPHETFQEHLDIISALEAKDGDRAEELMRRHVRTSIARFYRT